MLLRLIIFYVAIGSNDITTLIALFNTVIAFRSDHNVAGEVAGLRTITAALKSDPALYTQWLQACALPPLWTLYWRWADVLTLPAVATTAPPREPSPPAADATALALQEAWIAAMSDTNIDTNNQTMLLCRLTGFYVQRGWFQLAENLCLGALTAAKSPQQSLIFKGIYCDVLQSIYSSMDPLVAQQNYLPRIQANMAAMLESCQQQKQRDRSWIAALGIMRCNLFLL